MDQFDWLGGSGARTPPTPARGGGPATPSMPGATVAAAQAAQAAAGGGGASGSASSSANSRQQRSLASAAPVDDWLHLSTLMLETLDDDPSTPSDAMLDEMALQRLMQSGGGGGQASASSSSSSNVPFHQMSVSDMAIATQQAILASSLFANSVGGLGSLSPLDFPAMDNSLLGLGMGLGSGVSPSAGLNIGHIAGIPVLNHPVGMGLNVNPSQSSSSGARKFSSPATQVLASLTPPQKQRQSVGSLSSAAAAAATATSSSAAAAASSSSSSSAPSVKVKTEQEMDKRKRNTEASARFRAKKKIKQQMLEMSTKELTERVELLERRLQEYSMEIIMLRQELACDTSGQRKSLRDIYAENNVEYHPENLTAAGQGMLERGLIGIGAVSNTSSTFELGLGPNQSDDGYAGSDYFGDMMGEPASGGQAEAHLDAMALNAAAAAAATAACENAPVLTSSSLNQTGSSGSDNGSKRQKRK